MATLLQDLEEQIARLSPGEKARVVQILAPALLHAWPGIEKTAGIAGGDARIVRTRIPIWTLESYRRLGWSEARILDNFPTLRAADLVNAWGYADAHVDEMDAAIQENDEA